MLRDPVRQNKMQPIYTGPFKILRRTKGGSYELSNLQGDPLARAVAPSMLKPIVATPALLPESIRRGVNPLASRSAREALLPRPLERLRSRPRFLGI